MWLGCGGNYLVAQVMVEHKDDIECIVIFGWVGVV